MHDKQFYSQNAYHIYLAIRQVFVSPAKQKRDICTAFPAAALSSSSAAAA